MNCIISKRESKRHFLSFQRFEFLNTLIVLFDDTFGNLTYETEPVWTMVIEILIALCFKLSNKELNFHKCPICAHTGCLSKKKGQTCLWCLPLNCCSLPQFGLFVSGASMSFYTKSLPLNYSRKMYLFILKSIADFFSFVCVPAWRKFTKQIDNYEKCNLKIPLKQWQKIIHVI